MSENLVFLTHLYAEDARVSALIASLDDTPLGEARAVFLLKLPRDNQDESRATIWMKGIFPGSRWREGVARPESRAREKFG